MLADPGERARADAPRGEGAAPAGATWRGAPGTLVAAAALGAAPFVGAVVAIPVLLVATAVCQRRGEVPGRNATLLAALALGSTFLPNGAWAWPAVTVVLAAAALRPAWRGPAGVAPWFRRGTLSRTDLAWVAAVAAASSVALVLWKALRRPDVA